MAPRILNWGLMGTARINASLFPAFGLSQRCRLLAVASRTEERARAYAAEWKIGRAWGSYQALLRDPEIDVIYVPLPNGLHAKWAIEAADAGKHVLCEKPLAMSVQEVDEISAAARRNGVIVAEAFMYRHHPQTLKVEELVRSGAIGKVRYLQGAFTFNLRQESDVRLDPALGGGSIWDVGCYPISYMRTILGAEPLDVAGWQTTGSTGIDMGFSGQMRFPGDVYGQFVCGFDAEERQLMEIAGEDGTLHVPDPFTPEGKRSIVLNRPGAPPQQVEIPETELYLGEIEDMADAVLLGKEPRVTLTDSRNNVAAIRALLESSRLGRPVAVAR